MKRFAAIPLFFVIFAAGCHTAAPDPGSNALDHQHQVAVARQDLSQLPPPSKTAYQGVRDLDTWANPSITVQEKMLTIHVLQPDANPSDLGKGTMLRPIAARRQTLNIDPKNLAEALNAIPKDAWPYGRVVAIEEAHNAPASVQPALRRVMEGAIDTLNSVGIVADEWQDGRPIGVR